MPFAFILKMNRQLVIFEEDDFENAMELQKQTELTAFFKYI